MNKDPVDAAELENDHQQSLSLFKPEDLPGYGESDIQMPFEVEDRAAWDRFSAECDRIIGGK